MPVYTMPDLNTGAEGGSSVVGDSNNNHTTATRDSDDHRSAAGGGMWGNENEYRVFKLARELMNLPVTNGQGMENGDMGESGYPQDQASSGQNGLAHPQLNGMPMQGGLSHMNGFPQQNGYSAQNGVVPKQNGYPPNSSMPPPPPPQNGQGFPPQNNFSQQNGGMPAQQNGFSQQNGYTQQNGFHQQNGFAQQNGYSPAQQHGYAPHQSQQPSLPNGQHAQNGLTGPSGGYSAPAYPQTNGAENYSMYRPDSNSPERGDLGPPLGPRRSGAKANTTETVRVPSSEHVAEIVGRQGCKIKDLRAKTNTYIKTPVRGEEPVFVVTGRKEDVMRAMQEIRDQSDHFSEIRANRHQDRHLHNCHECKRFVEVPYKLVGLVVGPKGATVKKIQEETGAYIITPNRSAEPVFEVRGKQSEVDLAAARILQHIEDRTGQHSGSRSLHGQPSSPSSSSSVSSMPSVLGEFNGQSPSQFSYAPLTSSTRHNATQNGFTNHNGGSGFGGPQLNGLSNGLSNGQHNGYTSGMQQQQQGSYSNGFNGFSNGFGGSGGSGGGVADPFNGTGCWGSPSNQQRYSGSQDGFSPAHGLDTRRSSGSLVEEDRVFNNISSNFDFSDLTSFSVLSGAGGNSAFGAIGANPFEPAPISLPALNHSPGSDSNPAAFGATGLAVTAAFPHSGTGSMLDSLSCSLPTSLSSSLPSVLSAPSFQYLPTRPDDAPPTRDEQEADPLRDVAHDISRQVLGDEEDEEEKKEEAAPNDKSDGSSSS